MSIVLFITPDRRKITKWINATEITSRTRVYTELIQSLYHPSGIDTSRLTSQQVRQHKVRPLYALVDNDLDQR